MSSYISDIYANEIHNNLRPLYANWEPSQPVALGDYGILNNRVFIRLANVQSFNIPFKERKKSSKDQRSFASKGTSDVKFNAKGSVPANGVMNVNANLEINFSSERGVFFNAAECEYVMIDDKVALGSAIMALYKGSQWKREWAVVTDLVIAGSTTIAVSGGNSSSVVLEAAGDVPNIDLADASVGLTVKTSHNVGYQVVAAQGLVPLIGLCQIRPSFLGFGSDFRPRSLTMHNPAILEMRSLEKIAPEGESEALNFSQLD